MPPFLIPTTLLMEKFAMKTCKTLLLVHALCIAVGSAYAVPFTDIRNFEGASAGPFGGGWNISSATQEVVTDGSTQSPFGLNGGFPTTDMHGLRLTNATASDTPQIGASLSPNPNVNIPYYFQFDFKSIGDVDNAGMFIGGSSGRAINLHMSSENSTFVSVNQGGGFGNISGMELANDTWYRFTLTINPLSAADDTFDLRVQSLESTAIDVTATGLGFQNDTNDLNDFRFHFNSVPSVQGGQFAIDNTRWTTDANTLVFDAVPEPGSLALLSVGSLMMIKRRRRA